MSLQTLLCPHRHFNNINIVNAPFDQLEPGAATVADNRDGNVSPFAIFFPEFGGIF